MDRGHDRRRSSKESGKRHGGWPVSPRLPWPDVRAIYEIAHEMAAYGLPSTHFVTIMPWSGRAPERKRTCSRVIAHLGQALVRGGYSHYGLTIIEHPIDADLHAHHLLHVPVSMQKRVEAWGTSSADIRVQPISDIDGLLGYLAKERQRLSPDFEAQLRKRSGPKWTKCRPVVGKRWSTTTPVSELLAGSAGQDSHIEFDGRSKLKIVRSTSVRRKRRAWEFGLQWPDQGDDPRRRGTMSPRQPLTSPLTEEVQNVEANEQRRRTSREGHAGQGPEPRLDRTIFTTSRLLDFCSEKELTAQTRPRR